MILSSGQTGVTDRGYQCQKSFDQWQTEGKHFVCRIKANTKKTCIRMNPIPTDSIVFYDAVVLLGTPNVNQTKKEIRVVAYRIDDVEYWVATDRHDLTAEQIAFIYKLRWQVEPFFAWWKRHLKVYHLIARTEYGLMVQILSGLITCLCLAIYCQKHDREKVSIKRVRELRFKIENEIRDSEQQECLASDFKKTAYEAFFTCKSLTGHHCEVADYQAAHLKKVRFLYDQGAATIAELNLAQSNLYQSEANLRQMRSSLALRRLEDLRLQAPDRPYETRARLIQAELEALAEQQSRLLQKSPVRGRVLEVFTEVGSLSARGS